jgi:peptidoglycan/LPS O-acetylase OafA/YrhL
VRFRADIQGLRALAVLLVIAHHFFPESVTGGFFGVDVFFVISGYIITSNLMESPSKSLKKFLLDFYARRVRRILPSALVVILLSVVATYLLLGSITGSDTARDGVFASLFIANIHFNSSAMDYFAAGLPQPILQHYWSLAIEEQFYLLWPLIFFFSRKSTIRVIAVITLSLTSFAYAIVEISSASPTAYLSTLTRVWELGIGAAVALLNLRASNRLISYTSVISLIVLSLLYTPNTDFPGFPALVVALLTCAVIITADSNKVLASKVMTWIGDRSYTLYLVHWPIFQIAFLYRGISLVLNEKILLLLLLTVVSTALFRYLEDPIRCSETLKRNPHQTIAIGIGASMVTILILESLRSLV